MARALTWPIRLADLETQVCQLVGDEFYDRLRSPGTGLHPAQWLRALAEETGAALRATPARGTDDWQKLWALLCGLALMTPRTPAGAAEEPVRERLPEFPDIKDPLETALAEAEKFARPAADRGVEPGLGHLADGCRPAGEPLVAGDVYGSRRLVMAPFSYDGGAPDHWYAWAIDLCWIAVVAGAGVFASAEDALGEWRDAVGPAASGAALSSCPAGMTAQLLAPCLTTGPPADMLQGNEPRDLIREYYRLRRRARDLTRSADAAAREQVADPEDHLARISARKTGQARSNKRAPHPQGGRIRQRKILIRAFCAGTGSAACFTNTPRSHRVTQFFGTHTFPPGVSAKSGCWRRGCQGC